MKRVILGGLLVAAGAAGSSALAADDTGAMYISGLGTYTLLDGHRVSKDDFGYSVELGKDFSPNWAGEINYDNGSFKIRNSGFSQKLAGYSVDGLYKFSPDSLFRPFLLAGGGMLDDAIGTGGKNHTFMAEAGVGLLTGIGSQTGSTRVQFRTQAKYRLEWANPGLYGPKDPSDLILGVGLQVSFGAPVAAPVLAAAPPPPPPPAPPPPPPPPAPLDSDGDGVPDSIDQCPNTPQGDKVDSVGCTIKDEIKLERVHFATDSAVLEGDNSQVLDYAVATLKKYPQMVIEVRGHTDNTGSKKHNQLLSERRAETVMTYLKEHGVSNHLTAEGFGEQDPIADNSTPEGRQKNRRVGLRIVGGP